MQGVSSAPSMTSTSEGATHSAERASPSALVLLLAKLCLHLETTALPCAVEATAAAFEGAGGGRGADLPPAFVPAQVSR